MKWISVKDRLPMQTGVYYLVLSDKSCDLCIKNESHPHRLDFKRYTYGVARWSAKDLTVYNYYKDKTHDWDFCAQDHWSECMLSDAEITHWMPFVQEPDYEQ